MPSSSIAPVHSIVERPRRRRLRSRSVAVDPRSASGPTARCTSSRARCRHCDTPRSWRSRASSNGSQGRSRLLTWTATSRSATATCTWHPRSLFMGDHPESLGDLAVARLVGDGEACGRVAATRRRAVVRPPPRQSRRQRDASWRCHAGDRRSNSQRRRRLDLAAGQLQLEVDAPALGVLGNGCVEWGGLPVLGSTRRNSSSTPKVGRLEVWIRPIGSFTTGRIRVSLLLPRPDAWRGSETRLPATRGVKHSSPDV